MYVSHFTLRPAFISMLYPETLAPHFRAMTAGVATVFNFDKINSLEEMSDYMKWVECFSRQEEYPPGFEHLYIRIVLKK